ncbi:uncharacterized protein [Macaca nemestrina]|uniref:uncharacterized protein n=1 Tax=Macaca nemestrina TaxID=9545 RepID=UPI0039B9589C
MAASWTGLVTCVLGGTDCVFRRLYKCDRCGVRHTISSPHSGRYVRSEGHIRIPRVGSGQQLSRYPDAAKAEKGRILFTTDASSRCPKARGVSQYVLRRTRLPLSQDSGEEVALGRLRAQKRRTRAHSAGGRGHCSALELTALSAAPCPLLHIPLHHLKTAWSERNEPVRSSGRRGVQGKTLPGPGPSGPGPDDCYASDSTLTRSPSARNNVWGRGGCYPEAECGIARVPTRLSLPPARTDSRPRRAPTRQQHRPRHKRLTRLLPNRKLEAARPQGALNALKQNRTQTRAFSPGEKTGRVGKASSACGNSECALPRPETPPRPGPAFLSASPLPARHVLAPPFARRFLLTRKRILRSQGPLGPYVSANPPLRGDRFRQEAESGPGVRDLPNPVTARVLLTVTSH